MRTQHVIVWFIYGRKLPEIFIFVAQEAHDAYERYHYDNDNDNDRDDPVIRVPWEGKQI